MLHACRLAVLAAAIAGAVVPLAAGADRHLDCQDGDDARDGRTPETAWRSLARVNRTTFAPGDAILLRRGTRCTGTLAPRGSGAPDRPIRIAAYGEGPLPVVDAAGAEAAVALYNQQHWHVESVEATGGDPYGIHISGDRGTLRHFRIRNAVVHGVTGEPETKTSGLVVISPGEDQTFEDVVVDGVTAYDTSQWAGILVRGSARADPRVRARGVTVRNSIVHDVAGDGIVLFQVEDGLIERSAAWRIGLQERETIGTPSGIWTWRCRRCVVQWNEGFFTDSPGVDGGVYDIDWGNDDNVIQYNFGHDAMGYCASIFAANGEVTTNAVIRYNVCVNNGRSPKLARRQGDLYVTTWDGGKLDGVRVHDNTFYWNPPIDTPAVRAEAAELTGDRPAVFLNNLVYSTVPSLVRTGDDLLFDHNLYWYTGHRAPRWSRAGRDYEGFDAYRRESGQDAAGVYADPELSATLRPGPGSPAVDAGRSVPGGSGEGLDAYRSTVPAGGSPDIGAVERAPLPAATAGAGSPPFPGSWALVSHLTGDDSSRSQVVFLQSALEQYGERGLVVAVVLHGDVSPNLPWDWNLGGIRRLRSGPAAVEVLPTTLLVAPDGVVARRWQGFAPPADLGLTLRSALGPPAGAPPVELEERSPHEVPHDAH